MESSSAFNQLLQDVTASSWLEEKTKRILCAFFHSYLQAVVDKKEAISCLSTFFRLVEKQIKEPYPFSSYHQKITSSFNYYQFGIDFISPLVDQTQSTLTGQENIATIYQHLALGHNIIFFANHQIEADPQAISILLQKNYPFLAEEMIFVAGQRVLMDPVAAPFSLGRNLLCIYSKRHIASPPELKADKQLHNQRAMSKMQQLLEEGGKVIYVAPSGGRDRPNTSGAFTVAPFDEASIEMFYLITKKAKTSTHFYPMALLTHNLLPPPRLVQTELGEDRSVSKCPVHLAIGKEIAMNSIPTLSLQDKKIDRKRRAESIWTLVCHLYQNFPS